MISNRQPPVAVEYDGRAGRERREFADPFVARRFYAAKLRAGRAPAVKRLDDKENKHGTHDQG